MTAGFATAGLVASIVLLAAGPAEALPSAPAAWDVRERVRCDLLVVLAHPDDEGVVAPLLAREALEAKRRVGVVYLTDGRNGTNRAGTLAGRSFGLVRLAEASWTLDRLGVSILHSLDRADDLGSGDPRAILREWDREATVRELTRLVRLHRPGEIITWFPGPASSNPDHAASGGAALLAAASASDPAAWPEQIRDEGLEPHATPAIWLVTQTEKLGYALFPDPRRDGDAVEGGARIIDLDVASPALGRRYTDVAREALREQRAVGAASNLGRDGPFDEPLRLMPFGIGGGASREAGGGPGAGSGTRPLAVRIEKGASPMQVYLESLAAEIGAPGLLDAFPPEAVVKSAGDSVLTIAVELEEGTTGRLSIDPPSGWKSVPERREVTAGAGGRVALDWTLRPPAASQPGHFTAELIWKPSKRGGPDRRAPIVLTVPSPRPGR